MFCISTVVSGKAYQEYIPHYIYSILHSYPDYHVKVFCREKLRRNVRESITELGALGNCEVKDRCFPEYPDTKTNNKACRWLIPEEEFSEFDHVYIGDIDFFILPEDPPFLEQHLAHTRTLGVPYSNIVRPEYDTTANTFSGSHQLRITGLHFIHRKEYYRRVTPIQDEFREQLKEPKEGSDEKFLYSMITKAFGEPRKADPADFQGKSEWVEEHGIGGVPHWSPEDIIFRPYHGIHYGAFRPKNKEMKRSGILNNRYYGKTYLAVMDTVRDDPMYQRLLKNSSRAIRKRVKHADDYIQQHRYDQR